jgi:hypothetical protein
LVREAVDNELGGGVVNWRVGTGVLLQTWSSNSKGWSVFKNKGGTLQCTDLAVKGTIDAQGSSEYPNMRTVLAVEDTDGVYLTGLVITGGFAFYGGGGIYIISSTVTITSCEIRDNNASWDGGGIQATKDGTLEYGSTVEVYGTLFSGNLGSVGQPATPTGVPNDIDGSSGGSVTIRATCPAG